MKRVLLSWSSGKDSAWSLFVLRRQTQYEVAGLLTTFNEAAGRVAMHAVRRELVERQALAAGLPLWAVPLPWLCSNEQYEHLMGETCAKAVARGVEGIAFGDLFLEDVRAYRETTDEADAARTDISCLGVADSRARRRDDCSGVRARITCIDTQKLDASFAGQEFDQEFLTALPDGNDPCGEHGEFHSFVLRVRCSIARSRW